MPSSRGSERRTKPRGPQGLPLRVQVTAAVALVALVPAVTVALWLVPLAFPEAWSEHAGWFVAWIVGLAAVVLVAALLASRVMVGPLTRIARDLDALRARSDLRATTQIRHRDGDPREVASVKRSVLSLLQRIDEDRERRSTLLATLTHDINTSVVAARNVTELITRGQLRMDDTVTAGLARELDTLHDRTRQLIDMLRFDRVDLDMQPEQVALRHLVDEAIARVRDASRRSDIRVDVTGDATVDGDRAALVRAVENLLANAVRHARARVEVDIRPGAIRVTDDGPGFATAFDDMTKAYATDPDAATAAPEAGSSHVGMGLYVARLIAEAHGGRLVLEDTGPEGATVGFHLQR